MHENIRRQLAEKFEQLLLKRRERFDPRLFKILVQRHVEGKANVRNRAEIGNSLLIFKQRRQRTVAEVRTLLTELRHRHIVYFQQFIDSLFVVKVQNFF